MPWRAPHTVKMITGKEMVKKKNYLTETYDAGDGFLIDITETETMYEAYMYREEMGLKAYLFTQLKAFKLRSKKDFIEFVESMIDEKKEQLTVLYKCGEIQTAEEDRKMNISISRIFANALVLDK